MPIHWPTVYAQIEARVQAWQEQQARQAHDLAAARAVLERWAARPAEMAARVQALLDAHPNLGRRHRFAWPLTADRWDQGQCPSSAESAAAGGCPRPTATPPGEVWAADGSQIAPDRHAAVLFGLVNVGVVRMSGSATPQVFTHTELYLEPDLAEAVGDEREFIAARRDLAEVGTLADAMLRATDRAAPTYALLDGPLEFWRRGGAAQGEARRDYASALGRLRAGGVWPAGYVDRPRSAMLVHTLALLDADAQGRLTDSTDLRQHWPGLTDAMLWADLLRAGQRSVAFRLWTPVPPDGIAFPLAFFYLRLPRPAALARVDIPLDAADDPDALDGLHAHLWHQVHIVPGRFYPYILLRAHEVALVTYQERRGIETYLQRRLAEALGQLGRRSAKQQLKDAVSGGRRRGGR